MNKALVLGASGATGSLLVKRLLQHGVKVIAIVRSRSSIENSFIGESGLQIVEAGISKITEDELVQYLQECDVVFSCLGHNLTFKGLFGQPRRLVTDAIKKAAKVINLIGAENKTKVILMNTTGNSNRDIPETPPLSQRIIVALLRLVLPPHADNEDAADFLRLEIGQSDQFIEWVVVRPDTLINEQDISRYDIVASPLRNVIFNAGKTSRINVADFMCELAINAELWNAWKGKMPVIYNHEE